jgi:hypothetical protein
MIPIHIRPNGDKEKGKWGYAVSYDQHDYKRTVFEYEVRARDIDNHFTLEHRSSEQGTFETFGVSDTPEKADRRILRQVRARASKVLERLTEEYAVRVVDPTQPVGKKKK